MTLPLNHSKDRARLIAEYALALKLGRFTECRMLKAAIANTPEDTDSFNTQSTDSGG